MELKDFRGFIEKGNIIGCWTLCPKELEPLWGTFVPFGVISRGEGSRATAPQVRVKTEESEEENQNAHEPEHESVVQEPVQETRP